MKAAEIRRTFIEHFVHDHAHMEVGSASLVPSAYDPSILLNTAGMQPFKPFFAGLDQPPSSRVTSCQKCFRTPDIDEVGLTARHLTFFEMLGNFSFGDYFKQGAIEMAWQLVTEKLGLDIERLWATIHEGSEALGLEADSEARELWLAAGLPNERIVELGEDNFWKAGATGPCGPCSELYYDRGEKWGCGQRDCKPGCECDRYLEFYNLVFMQYTRDDSGKLTELPQQNIDTGMGLERIASILQGNVSVFEIDSVQPIVNWVEKRSGKNCGVDPLATKAMRVLIDHGRGMSFLASDGVRPSNEGRGYVLRRIIRRAIQHADRIGMYPTHKGGLLSELHALVVAGWSDQYPELLAQSEMVAQLLASEEERFLRTLDAGLSLLEQVLTELDSGEVVSGDAAFQLHDTHGFPVELTEEIAGERGYSVDLARFNELMREQRERARAASGSGSLPLEQAAAFVRTADASEFVGYETVSIQTKITALERVSGDQAGQRILLKLSESPFYAEGGGQVSDEGQIRAKAGVAIVEQVMRFDSDQVIVATLDGELAIGDQIEACVDVQKRTSTQSNHTATHLLHAALREVLGEHVHQAGSLVEPGRLRFDFSHPSSVSAADLERIEQLVNEAVVRAEKVTAREVSIEEAKAAGAMMLFGEKYGERVRMVSVGDGNWSLELCGGTHVTNTAQIRQVLITNESSVGASTRRIEALTGAGAIKYLRKRSQVADAAAKSLGVEVDKLVHHVLELHQTSRRLEKELSAMRSGGALDAALNTRVDEGPFSVVVYRDDSLASEELLDLADRIKGKLGAGAVVILGSAEGESKVSLVVSAADGAIAAGAHAGNIVKVVAGIVGGGGGGRPNMARAGGRDAAHLDKALAAGRSEVAKLV